MSNFEYKLSTLTKYRSGTIDDPYVDITQSSKVFQQRVVLNEIPVFFNKVQINGLLEVSDTDISDLGSNQYRVDYHEGVVFFPTDQENLTKTITYKGRGNHFVSSSRIWTKENNGEVSETLQDLIHHGGSNLTSNNVKSYGAVGDGTTDDTLAIQQCFDEALPNSSIFFPDGTYIVTGVKLFQKERVTIFSYGATLKLKNNTNQDILTLEQCPYSSINGLNIDGNKMNQSEGTGDGLVFKATYFSLITACRIVNAKRDGLRIIAYFDPIDTELFRGNDEVHINRCFIQSNGRHGVYIDSVADLNIDSNNIEFNGDVGVVMTQTTGIPSGNSNITNNQILSNDGHGLEFLDGCSRIIVSSNHIRNNGKTGIRYIGGKQFFITNNNVHLNGRLFPYSAGIIVGYNNNGLIANNMITCTDFSPTQGYGLEAHSVTSIRVSGNVFDHNLFISGLSISPDCTDVLVTANIGVTDSSQ